MTFVNPDIPYRRCGKAWYFRSKVMVLLEVGKIVVSSLWTKLYRPKKPSVKLNVNLS